MTSTLIFLALLAVLAAGVAVNRFAQYLGDRRVAGRRVIVNLKSGQAIDGVLIRRAGDYRFLKDATLYEGTSEPVRLDGEVLVDRHNIDFIQTP